MLNFGFMSLFIKKILSKIYKMRVVTFLIDVMCFLSVKQQRVNTLTFY